MNLSQAKIHFIGIGGIGMCGIAEVLSNMGCQVSGSDQSVNAQVERLMAMGVPIAQGHQPSNIPKECNAVVYSSAVKSENPEMIEAKRRKIPVIQRAEMLAELMNLKRGIAIGGTHGKTTTTSMTAAVMLYAKLDPTIVIGGRLDLIQSTAALGKGEWLLAEADESDGSFLRLSPEISVITNIDNDHLDHHGTFEALKKAFVEFANGVPFHGCAILCVDDPYVFELSESFEKRKITYGVTNKADLRAVNIQQSNAKQKFDIEYEGKPRGTITLQVPGHHNVLNALAAIAVGLELKLDFSTIAAGLTEYRGVDRRLQLKGEFNGALIIDDYGHHPTEVEATLGALKEAYPKRRLIAVFQPHRYSRTQTCWARFLECFESADVVGLIDIYPAGEMPISGVSSENLIKALSAHKKNAFYWKDLNGAFNELKKQIKSGDVVVTLGAGDIWKLGPRLLSETSAK